VKRKLTFEQNSFIKEIYNSYNTDSAGEMARLYHYYLTLSPSDIFELALYPVSLSSLLMGTTLSSGVGLITSPRL